MTIVLDASATLDFLFEEGDRVAIDRLIWALKDHTASTPQHWRLEVANGLTTRLRRGILTREQADEMLAILKEMNIAVDEQTGEHVWNHTFNLANEYRLTVYDAAYLELALRLAAPLATFDNALAQAARISGVTLFFDRASP